MSTWMAGGVAASLPALSWMQLWLRLGWGLVLAALAVGLLAWVQQRRAGALNPQWARASAAMGLLLCLLPNGWSPAFWLGLAFQAPSLTAGVVAVLVLAWHGVLGVRWMARARATLRQCGSWALAGVLLGWVLLLDSFAFWPVFVYPTGFGVGVWLGVLAFATVGWAWRGGSWRSQGATLVVLAVWALSELTQLPSGNTWDALLDPWLWLACHVPVLQGLVGCYKKRSAMRTV